MTYQIESIKNNVIFKFIEDATSTRFINSTSSGILVAHNDGTQASIPRWGKVTHVGPDVQDVAIDDFILIEAGMWTPGFYVNGERFWKTDDQKVMCLGDEPTTTY